MHWLKLETKLLFAGYTAKLGLFTIIICAILAIYLGDKGYQQVKQQQTTMQQTFNQNIEKFEPKAPSAGRLGYYLFGPTYWQLSPWSALFVGQSQSAHASMPMRALALQGQIYNTEINNPTWQQTGRLDVGFVLIYLLPILLGILCVNLLSEERQANRWAMISALHNGSIPLIWRRLLLISVIVLLIGFTILLTAALWLSLPLDNKFWWLMTALTVYMLFWTLVVGAIIKLTKSSVFNTLAFMSIWMLVCVLIPASIQLYLHHQFKDHSALHATLEQRMVMNNGWDQDRQITFNAFKSQYPQYSNYQLPESSGSWQWYYGQQHMSDYAVKEHWQAYQQQQQQKFAALEQLSLLSPSLMMQLAVNKLGGSSGQQHFDYQMQVADYHKQIREYLYPHLFSEQQPTSAIVANYPRFMSSPSNQESSQAPQSFSALWLLLMVFGLVGYLMFKIPIRI